MGNLGSVTANENGRGEFQLVSDRLKVWDIIGRSMVVHAPPSLPHLPSMR